MILLHIYKRLKNRLSGIKVRLLRIYYSVTFVNLGTVRRRDFLLSDKVIHKWYQLVLG